MVPLSIQLRFKALNATLSGASPYYTLSLKLRDKALGLTAPA